MALNANALTTVARMKTYLEIASTTHDTRLELLINAVSNYFERITGRKFKRQAYTSELYDGKNSKHLYLKNYPIISGQTFTLQHRTSSLNENSWETVDAEDYFIDYATGRLTLVAIDSFATAFIENFTAGVQNFRVTYTAGFYLPQDAGYGSNYENDLPSDIEELVWEMVSTVFNKRKSAGIERSRVRDIEVWFSKTASEDPILKGVINAYRRKTYA